MSTTAQLPDVGTINPFPGLRPFKIEESHLFFGREGQSDEVLLKLSKSRFVGVIGPSGSGKSSFIYCGVLPILYGGFLTDASANWEVVVTRPGAGPIDNMAESLLRASKDYSEASADDRKIKKTILATLLRSSSLGLVEAIQQSRRREDINYLVLVDQFEELFRFKDSTDANSVNETLAFVNLLMEAVNYDDAPIYIAITMRSDFIGDCAQFPELTRKLNDSHYLIPQMTRDQKRRAIEGPVAVGGAQIAPRLVQQLLNDLGDNPDQLPILQHALMRTWSYWSQYRDYEEESVDLKHYEAIGTMAEALSLHANEAYEELDDEQKRVCEIMFKAITEKRGESFGIRRPTRLAEIAAIADVSEVEVAAIIEKFREPGRSLLTPSFGMTLGSKSMIDISHESLMRIWTRLKNWVDDESEAVNMYIRLAEAASMYQVGKAGLWRPPDLQLALNWQAKHKPTLVWGQRYHPAFERTLIFLEYSKKEFETEQRIKELEQKRKLQRARTAMIVFGSLLIVALMFLVFAIYQRTVALENEKQAREQEQIAIAEKNRADQEAERAIAEKLAADSARAVAVDQRAQAIAARNDAELRRIEAVKAREEAVLNERRAIAGETLARQNEETANKERERAEANAIAAREEKMRAISKALAIKSKDLENDPELEALLAQQAYLFNVNFKGDVYDNDIYNGLYYALRSKDHPITKSLEGHVAGAARALVTRTNDSHIYSGGSDGMIIQWNLTKDGWVKNEIVPDRRKAAESYQVYSMDISPDGNLLAAGGINFATASANYAELYDLRTNKLIRKVPGFIQAIENVQFTPDGRGFYARDNSGRSIRLADLTTAREVIKTEEKITSIDLNSAGTMLAGAGASGNLYLWEVNNGYKATTIKMPGRGLSAVTFFPSGDQLLVGSESGRIWLVAGGIVRRELTGHSSTIEQIRFNHAGNFFATASKDFTIRLWNVSNLNTQPILMSNHDWVWTVAFSPDDQQLMVGIQSAKEKTKSGQLAVDQTIHAYPTQIKTMATLLCPMVTRNLTAEEWALFIGESVERTKTCAEHPLDK
jgi:WD40 repeat protein/energy-coupling factor transporter ATP-binding protein EcfA2